MRTIKTRLKFILPSIICAVFAALLLTTGCKKDEDDPKTGSTTEETVAIVNRNSGSISFIDVETDAVVYTLTIADAELMYAVYVPTNDKLYVGDRANSQVHQIDPATRSLEESINVGNGVFHMWAGGDGKQLWVNGDVDNTISVIDLSNNTVVKTIDLGIKPHDVFVTKDGKSAYVSIINENAMVSDSIYMFAAANFEKTGAVAVGKDPHLFHSSNSNEVFVPCQSGQVYVLDGNNLNVKANNTFEGAHGIFLAPDQKFVYVANISGEQLYTIDAANNQAVGEPVSTLGTKPHNLAVIETGDKLYVTHSGGMANTVSTYKISDNGSLTAIESITVETNPFGLAYYKRTK